MAGLPATNLLCRSAELGNDTSGRARFGRRSRIRSGEIMGGHQVSFRLAKRDNAKPLIGLYALSGHGKTKSALLLAKGFCGDMSKVGMIETEAGRGEVFAQDEIVGG